LKIHQITIEDALKSLHTTHNGLTSDEARRRLGEFGSNAIRPADRKPLILRFLAGFTHFFALILWCGASIAFFAEWREPGQGMFVLGCAILGVIIINGLFSFWQEYRAEQAINALQKLIPHEANVMRDGKLQRLSTEELVPGDVISLQDGDDVPADSRILSSFRLRVNSATITGESAPSAKDAIQSGEDDAMRSHNVLLAGTSIFSGEAQAVVYSTGMNTEFGKIARLTQGTEEALSPLQKEIVRLSRVIALIAVSVGALFFAVGLTIGISLWDNVIFALGIIVALVPEGLLPEVTLALATCAKRMARRNALMRHLPAVETLGCTTVICTDKTGTLTQNRMKVRELFLDGETLAITQESSLPERFQALQQRFVQIAFNCHNLKHINQHGIETESGDPMDLAMVNCARQFSNKPVALKRIDEIPFDSQRKRVSILTEAGEKSVLVTKGALEGVLPLCTMQQSTSFTGELTAERKKQLQEAETSMTNRGLRVLAVAHRDLDAGYNPEELEQNMIIVGLVGLEDPPRPEVAEAVSKCRSAGIKIIMVTGDHPNTALAIAREIKLALSAQPVIITGAQMQTMSDAALQLILDAPEIIFARTDPAQKMRIVQTLRRKGHVVAATGDGTNDAPAIKAADIGIAMGISGTDVAREAADMILADDNFASIVNAVEEGRAVFANIRKFLTYVLASNIAELIPCLAFILFRIPLPLATVQILSIDLGTDVVPALALGVEEPDQTAMQQPPRSRKEGLFDLSLLLRAYLFLGLIVAAGSMSAYFLVLHQGGWHTGMQLSPNDPLYKTATAACLIGLMCMQLVNSSMCRSEDRSIFSLGFFSNKFLLFGLACQISLMLFIDYTPWGNLIFRTAPLDLNVWLFMVPFMAGMLTLEEGRKLIVRHRRKNALSSV
jgi:sodium/potassium-transporting ATPase subunit alpha